MRESGQKVMDDQRLDALVYPTWAFPPRMIGDLNTPHGNNSPRLSPRPAFPQSPFPWGLCATACQLGFRSSAGHGVYGDEQATRHRRRPASTPPLPEHP
jgi:amidase